MPTLTCPHCQTPQSISDESFQKNLGKKCRCRQCQKVFTIESSAPPPAAEEGFGNFDWLNDDSPAPAPAAPPPPPAAKAKPVAAAKQAPPVPVAPPAPAAPAEDELDFSSLMGGEESTPPPAPVAEFPDFSSPEPASAPEVEAPEFPSFDEVAPTPAAAKPTAANAKPKVTQLAPPGDDDEGDGVARLPDRPALRTIARVFRVVSAAHFLLIGLALLAGMMGVLNAKSMGDRIALISWNLICVLGLIASAAMWYAASELIPWALAMEARLHEISRRTQPRS